MRPGRAAVGGGRSLRNWPKRAADAIKSYQPYWALAVHLLQRMEREDEAMRAFLTQKARGRTK